MNIENIIGYGSCILVYIVTIVFSVRDLVRRDKNEIFINLGNKEQVKWWNEKASKLVKVIRYTYIDEAETGKHAGVLLSLKGLRKNEIIRENMKFINNPVRCRVG
jgi:hypothetical protein